MLEISQVSEKVQREYARGFVYVGFARRAYAGQRTTTTFNTAADICEPDLLIPSMYPRCHKDQQQSEYVTNGTYDL